MKRNERGFTLIELLVSVVIMAIIVGGMMNAFMVQARMHQVVSDVSESHQKLALLIDMAEHDLRNSGYMVSDSAAVCGVDNTSGPDILYVSDAFAISSLDQLGASDENTDPTKRTYYIASKEITNDGMGASVASIAGNAITLNSLVLDALKDGSNAATAYSYDNTGDGINDSDFQWVDLGKTKIAGGVIMRDTSTPSKGVACGTITNINGNTLTIDWKATITQAAVLSDMLVIPAHVYEVGQFVTGTTASQLRRNGLIVANDIEDLQVTYFFDVDNDGITDTGEMRGDSGGTAYSAGEGSLAGTLRDVSVNLAVVTPFASEDMSAKGRPQDLANHDVTSTNPAADGFRRRIVTTTVRPRNIGLQ